MNGKRIGILGASGLVGQAAAKTILEHTRYCVVLGGRSLEKMTRHFPDMGHRGVCVSVDLFEKEQLEDFCRHCDVVVNCAGPSKKILDKVAMAAFEHGAHYVDVSGDDHLYSLLSALEDKMVASRLTCIISAGLFPGLSEIFPSYIAENYFDSLDSMELCFAGHGDLSLNAAYDYVCSIEEDYGEGMTRIRGGKKEKIIDAVKAPMPLPAPASGYEVFPVLTCEFKRLVDRYRVGSACFYNCFRDTSILSVFMKIKIMQQYKTDAEKRASAMLIKETFQKGVHLDDFTMFHLKASGVRDRQASTILSTINSHLDGNAISGLVAGNTARLLLDGEANAPGLYFLPDGVDINRLMEHAMQQGLHAETRIQS